MAALLLLIDFVIIMVFANFNSHFSQHISAASDDLLRDPRCGATAYCEIACNEHF